MRPASLHLTSSKHAVPGHQRAASIIEVLIVVAIIGIATTLAIPMYQVYTIRAQVSQGLVLSATHKIAIAAFHHDHGAFPTDNTAANLSTPGSYATKYVASISVDGAEVEIEYGNSAHQQLAGRKVTLTANEIQGSVHWSCSSGGSIPDDHLPPACR